MQTGKTKRKVKRLIAFLLCVIMVLGVGTQEIIGRDVFVVNAEEPEGGSGEAAPEEESSGEEPAEEEPPSGTEPQADEPSEPSEETTPEETAPETPEETLPEGTTPPETPEETLPEGTTPPETPEETLPEGTTLPETPEETLPEGTTLPETPEETPPETAEETTPEESTEETTSEESEEEETDPVTELVYEGEGFRVAATALEDVDLSGIEMYAAPAATEKAAELICEAKPGMDVAGILAYEISFTYEETGEAADLSGQAVITIEYAVPEPEEGLAEEAILTMFSMTGESVSELTEAEGTVLGDGTAEAPAGSCDLYALVWLTQQEQAYDETWEDEDGQVSIHVTADAGVIPRGAELSVTPITKTEITDDMSEEEKAQAEEINDQYDFTEEKLKEDSEENEEVMEGFLAYDICFLLEGEEVEPCGDVRVVIDFKEAAIPEGVSEDAAVSVKHLKDNETAKDGVVVEDMAEKAEVQTTDKAEVEKVELTTDSFSTYTVTWHKTKDGDEYPVQITSHYGYLDQNSTFVEFEYEDKKLPEEWQEDRNNEYAGGDYVLAAYAAPVTITGEDNTSAAYSFTQGYVVEGEDSGFSNELPARSISINKDTAKQSYYFYRGVTANRWEKVGEPLSETETKYIQIYFVYDKGLTTVETLDNSQHGITMTMTDLENTDQTSLLGTGGPTLNSGSGFNYYNVEQGILNRTLNEDGYPTLSGNKWDGDKTSRKEGTSLKELFTKTGTTTSVNHLFLSSTYEETGYYEYSSFENYAYLDSDSDSDSKNFIVYDALGTPKENEPIFYYQRGNFLPYNNIEMGKYSQLTNLYDEDGNPLPDSDEDYNAPLYYAGAVNSSINYHFAMTMNAEFYQPEDGLAEFGGVSKDMIYEFNGDDDLWVFIDDVLILDIGGIHDAHSGYINFKTGEVYVELGMKKNGDGTVEAMEPYSSTIKELFYQAGKFPDGTSWDENATDADIAKYFDGNTFADYSRHTMKMFYMERGEGASNLHIRFNLQTVPDGAIEVAKELSNTDKDKYANVDFQFELYVQKKEENTDPDYPEYIEKYVRVTEGNIGDVENPDTSGIKATLMQGGSPATDTSLRWTEDGTKFLLKPDQSVLFSGLKADQNYYVKEVGVNSQEYDDVRVNTVLVTEKDQDGNITSDLVTIDEDNLMNIDSGKDKVYDRPIVTFTNNCDENILSKLFITKNIEGVENSDDTFTFQIQFKTTAGNFENYVGPYYLQRDNTYYYYNDENKLVAFQGEEGDEPPACGNTTADGKVSGIKAGDTISVTGLLPGTEFKVQEVDLNFGLYDMPRYDVSGANTKTDTTTGEGWYSIIDSDASVTVTNYLKPQIFVEKKWVGECPSAATIYVGLYRDDEATDQYLELKSENGWSGKFTGLEKGENGKYTVKELIAVDTSQTPAPTSEFNIDGIRYIGVNDGDSITVSDLHYTVDYGELTSDTNVKIQQNITITNVQKWQIVKRSSSEGNQPLKDAQFTLTKKSANTDITTDVTDGIENLLAKTVVYAGTSGKNGVISWTLNGNSYTDVFPDGEYILEETKAPVGFSLGESWTITITNGIPSNVVGTKGVGDNTNITQIDGVTFYKQNNVLTLYYDNTSLYELPSTGGPGIYLYMLGGVLLLMAGALMVYNERKKEVSRS